MSQTVRTRSASRSLIKRRELRLVFLVAALAVLSGAWGIAGASGAEGSPTATVRQLLSALKSYNAVDGNGVSAEQTARNARALHVVDERLDVRLVAERTFGRRWGSLSTAERKEFIGVFKQLLERKAYPKSSTFFEDLTVEFLNERIREADATVETSVIHSEEGEILIDYRLRRDDGRWVITDVVLDGASLALDLRSQVEDVMSKESFADLIRRMKDRLAEG